MSRYVWFILGCWLAVSPINAQWSLQSIPGTHLIDAGGMPLSSWSWQITGPPGAYQATAIFVVQLENASGQIVWVLSAELGSMGSGTTVFAEDLEPGSIRSPVLTRWSCLPKGRYLVRAQLFGGPGRSTPLAETQNVWQEYPGCQVPIILDYPLDQDTLCEQEPLLWSSLAGMQYHLRIVEQEPDQQPEVAMQQNLPVVQNTSPQNLWQPTGALRTGQTYAWQVQAITLGGHPLGISQVQTFYAGCPKKESTRVPYTGPRIFRAMGKLGNFPEYPQKAAVFWLSFVQDQPATAYQLRVEDEQGNVLAQRAVNTQPGHNYLTIPLADLSLQLPLPDTRWIVTLRDGQSTDHGLILRFE